MNTLESVVYLLCTATSGICALLLLRAWLQSRQPLLVWSALCFLLLTVNNVLVFVDLVLLPNLDLTLIRFATSLTAAAVLLYGFVWSA